MLIFSLFVLCREERSGLVLEAWPPERSPHLVDGILRGKQLRPCLRPHSRAYRRTFIFFARILMPFHCHFHATGCPIQKLTSQFVALELDEPTDEEVCSESREQRIEDDRNKSSPGNKVPRCRTEKRRQLFGRSR